MVTKTMNSLQEVNYIKARFFSLNNQQLLSALVTDQSLKRHDIKIASIEPTVLVDAMVTVYNLYMEKRAQSERIYSQVNARGPIEHFYHADHPVVRALEAQPKKSQPSLAELNKHFVDHFIDNVVIDRFRRSKFSRDMGKLSLSELVPYNLGEYISGKRYKDYDTLESPGKVDASNSYYTSYGNPSY